MTRFAHVTGWGMATPDRILTNDDLAKMVDTSDDWILSRTGISERRIAEKGESTATLATDAALRALETTDLNAADIDLIIVSTSTPEYIFPSTACIVQDQIGASRAGAFDLSAACTGFIYAVNMAAQAIRSGSIENAIVIGAETLSRFTNWEDRDTCVLFGDGAGAFVLQASDRPGGVLNCVMRSDGSGESLLSLPAGGSKLPATHETVDKKQHTIQMNGREVFRFATRVMASATREAVSLTGWDLDDVNWVIPHQANMRIIEAAARGLRMPLEKFVINLSRYGNTSTASIPIAACEALQSGRIQDGDQLVLVGFGAGLTWGAMTLDWVVPERKISRAVRRRRAIIVLLARMRSFVRRLLRKVEGLIWGTSSKDHL
ncbi:MAG TPA: beta-ketoacyl-ACP synthase III [Anaerolineales bacterium]|nr:beta-ketoacyl-ACP synthase III [Anaerolineales bacterium]